MGKVEQVLPALFGHIGLTVGDRRIVRIKTGYHYGDLQFVTDESSDDFLNKGIFSCRW